ncbi:MAG: hypothetical protein JXJ22_13095 [Bacteroidales bacterium]|nr:hypothetical protein [Bacteroidales bacterium]
MSSLISLLHVVLTLKPELFYNLINLSQESSSAQTTLKGPCLTIAALVLALIFAIWGIYAFSGVGLIRPLPLLRKVLVAIGVIYMLRALFLPFEIYMFITKGYPFQFAVYSTISLVTGLLYLIGILKE